MSMSQEYLFYILDKLSQINGITYRPMMGEYIIYYREKVIGGIYDCRFLVKPTVSVLNKLDNVRYEIPYSGAKKMVMPDLEDQELLKMIIEDMYDELPYPKSRKKR